MEGLKISIHLHCLDNFFIFSIFRKWPHNAPSPSATGGVQFPLLPQTHRLRSAQNIHLLQNLPSHGDASIAVFFDGARRRRGAHFTGRLHFRAPEAAGFDSRLPEAVPRPQGASRPPDPGRARPPPPPPWRSVSRLRFPSLLQPRLPLRALPCDPPPLDPGRVRSFHSCGVQAPFPSPHRSSLNRPSKPRSLYPLASKQRPPPPEQRRRASKPASLTDSFSMQYIRSGPQKSLLGTTCLRRQ